jgi:hypothetical protein
LISISQIEEHITKLKDTFEFVEKHGSDKQAFLLAQTLKADLSDIEETIACYYGNKCGILSGVTFNRYAQGQKIGKLNN